jgi:hypothetical protein
VAAEEEVGAAAHRDIAAGSAWAAALVAALAVVEVEAVEPAVGLDASTRAAVEVAVVRPSWPEMMGGQREVVAPMAHAVRAAAARGAEVAEALADCWASASAAGLPPQRDRSPLRPGAPWSCSRAGARTASSRR